MYAFGQKYIISERIRINTAEDASCIFSYQSFLEDFCGKHKFPVSDLPMTIEQSKSSSVKTV